MDILANAGGSITIIFIVLGIAAIIILPYLIMWAFLKSAIRAGVKEAIEDTIIYQWEHQYNEYMKQQRQFQQYQQQQMMQKQGRDWQ